MKLAASLLLALVLLSSRSEIVSAFLALAVVPLCETWECPTSQSRSDNGAGKDAAPGAQLLHLMVESVVSNRDTSPPDAVLELQSFALYALSRGAGLSESGQRAIADFRELLRNMKAEGNVIEISDTRIGIEGETRICARFTSPEIAGKVWMQMRRSLVAADLVQLKPEKC